MVPLDLSLLELHWHMFGFSVGRDAKARLEYAKEEDRLDVMKSVKIFLLYAAFKDDKGKGLLMYKNIRQMLLL